MAIIIFKAQFGRLWSMRHLPVEPLILTRHGCVDHAHHALFAKANNRCAGDIGGHWCGVRISMGYNTMGMDVYTVIDFVKNLDPTKTTLKASLPTFHWGFSSEALLIVLPYAALAAAVGLIESLMTLTLVDELTETRGRGNKESIGQGIANIVNGCFGGMGGCAMIGQSMINIRGGELGRLSGITAALTLLFVLFGAPLIEAIPLAALVGVMFMVSIATFEWSSFRIIKNIPRSDALVIVVVSVVTVAVDLAIAVFIGVIMSALVFAWEQGKKIESNKEMDASGQCTYTLKGALFFGSVQSFKDTFDVTNDPNDIVIDCASMRVYDYSGIEATFRNVSERYQKYQKTSLNQCKS